MKNPIVDQIMQMMMGGGEAATGPVANPRMQNAQAPQQAGVDPEEGMAIWEAMNDSDQTGSEVGIDTDALNEAIKMYGEEAVFNAPAEAILPWIGRSPDESEAAFYNSLPPEQKQQILMQVVDSDGLGSISDYMPKQPETAAPKAPMSSKQNTEQGIIEKMLGGMK